MMLGLTLGIGPQGWGECATRAASRMESMTDVRCVVVTNWPDTPLVHPSWAKLWLQDIYPGEDLMIFDADLLACRPWDPVEMLQGYGLAWVRNRNRRAAEECKRYGLNLDRYATSGLLLVKADCPALKEARKYYPEYGPWYEEIPLNDVEQQGRFHVHLLPEEFNRFYYLGKGAGDSLAETMKSNPVNLHLVGLRGSPRRMSSVEKEIAACVTQSRNLPN